VQWYPEEPQSGENVKIVYASDVDGAILSDSDSVKLTGQYFFSDSDSIFSAEMTRKSNHWSTEIDIPDKAVLLSIKFEDNLLRTDHKQGRGWIVYLNSKDGHYPENAKYWEGEIYRGSIRPEAFPFYSKSIDAYAAELNMHSDNHKSLIKKWQLQLKIDPEYRKVILDSIQMLMSAHAKDRKILKLAFDVNYQILDNYSRCSEIGDMLLSEPKRYRGKDEIAYRMLYLKNAANPQKMTRAFESFVREYPDSKLSKIAYQRLADLYYRTGKKDRGLQLYQKAHRLNPNDQSIMLNIASVAMELGRFKLADGILDETENLFASQEYDLVNAWLHPRNRNSKKDLDYCQAYSLRASLFELTGDLESSIQLRRKALNLNTPFPVYELNRVGEAHQKLGQNEEAKSALIRSLSLDPAQANAREMLKVLYEKEGGIPDEFDTYLNDSLRNLEANSREMLPDFELESMDGSRSQLSQCNGDVVVLCFWDSQSRLCFQTIPELNEVVAHFADRNGVHFWAITNESESAVRGFLEGTDFRYRHFHTGYDIGLKLGVSQVPTHIIIDGKHVIKYKIDGYINNLKYQLINNIELNLNQ
jgi:tetratricopeptide (TPR) repeat protein